MKTWILLNEAKTKEAALSSYNLQPSRSVDRRTVNHAPRIGNLGSRSTNCSQVFSLFLLPHNTKLGVGY